MSLHLLGSERIFVRLAGQRREATKHVESFDVGSWIRVQFSAPPPTLKFRISNCGFQVLRSQIPISNPKSEIRNSKGWWRRRELNSDPRANVERLYMLSRFSSRPANRTNFARCRVSEVTRPQTGASPTLFSPTPTDRRSRPAHLSDISLRAHEQLAVRRSVLN